MGSLNGDIMVMRNGRSTSQVSVYNYPEHLNPFYEDDQHKRLRFWKITKKDNEGRRNSFSIGNLKDMWAFKSFRSKKKSSTLGINKTSESPPMLRRDYTIDNNWNTFDHRIRSSNVPSINGDSFQRNATYRSSLQTLPTSSDRIGLNRNDGYRSTIQVTRSNPRYQAHNQQQQQQQQKLQTATTTGVSQNRRYVYGGSVTPQPLRNTNVGRGTYNEYDCDNVMFRRSSQTSMASTNPFESDDDENEDINASGLKSVNGGSTTTLTSRTPRKKRRAPAPPTTTHNRSSGSPPPTILIESSQDNTNDELRIKEDIDIANLTAEIESFVKTKSNDDVEIIGSRTETTTTPTKISANNEETTSVTSTSKEIKNDMENIMPAPRKTSHVKASTVTTNVSTEGEIKPEAKTNGQVTTEIITVKTTTKTTTKPLEKKFNITKVTTDECTEIKSNGAIPKKQSNNSVDNSSIEQQQQRQQQTQPIAIATDLHIKETNNDDEPQKPVPLKRQTKTQPEVGHVECIHVHVESPRTTPQRDLQSGVSSFKTTESIENAEIITTKTPFVLTSPPTQRRKPQHLTESASVVKETVKIVGVQPGNERINELNITEERINTKPEVMVKPTLSPKPIIKEANSKTHAFAEIHKPMRNKFINNQSGHVRRASREESVSPPTVPLQKTSEEEKKINNSISQHIVANETSEKKNEVTKPKELQTISNLKIIETSNSISNNDTNAPKPMEKREDEERKETTKVTTVTSVVNNNEMVRRDEELDFLYRPKPSSHMEWKHSTLAPLETNIPPEKRKSVKDIIESINRSQRLLNAAANKDFTALQTTTTTTYLTGPATESVTTQKSSGSNTSNNLNDHKIINGRQRGPERMVEAMSATEAAGSPTSSPISSNCYNEHTDAQKLDNNEIFQKCKVQKEVYDYRESSPISSNLDWNPVPKPKRTKAAHE